MNICIKITGIAKKNQYMEINMEDIKNIKFEDVEIDEDLEVELNDLETELSNCGHDCQGDTITPN